MQLNNFVVNYRGFPYTVSIQDNKYLFRSLQGLYALVVLLLSDTFPPISDFLQLVRLPEDIVFQYQLGLILLFDLIATFSIEKLSQKLEM